MRTLEQWLSEYGESHRNPTNQLIHKFCVPLIMFSVLGLIWMIPVPDLFKNFKFMNWSTVVGLSCLVFYAKLNMKMFYGMIIMFIPMFLGIKYISDHFLTLMLPLMVGIFFVSWVFQFIGHKIEGKKPSFLKDLLFLLIGPLWVLKSFYKKMGLN